MTSLPVFFLAGGKQGSARSPSEAADTDNKNRRRLDQDLAVECAPSARYQRPLSYLMTETWRCKPSPAS